MTLVELMVALSLLVAMTTLVGMLWSQMRRWTDETGGLESAMRPDRTYAFLRSQWERRQAIVPVARNSRDCASLGPLRFEFVTTESALFPGWPLVRAAYVIESEISSQTPLPGDPVRLVYEETRVVRLDNFGEAAGGVDTNGDAISRRRPVLKDCRGLQWHVWTAFPPGETAEPGGVARVEHAAWAWRPLDGRAIAIGEMPAGVANAEESKPEFGATVEASDAREALEKATAEKKEEQERTSRAAARPKALRLTGSKDGREFAWSLIVEGSR